MEDIPHDSYDFEMDAIIEHIKEKNAKKIDLKLPVTRNATLQNVVIINTKPKKKAK